MPPLFRSLNQLSLAGAAMFCACCASPTGGYNTAFAIACWATFGLALVGLTVACCIESSKNQARSHVGSGFSTTIQLLLVAFWLGLFATERVTTAELESAAVVEGVVTNVRLQTSRRTRRTYTTLRTSDGPLTTTKLPADVVRRGRRVAFRLFRDQVVELQVNGHEVVTIDDSVQKLNFFRRLGLITIGSAAVIYFCSAKRSP